MIDNTYLDALGTGAGHCEREVVILDHCVEILKKSWRIVVEVLKLSELQC